MEDLNSVGLGSLIMVISFIIGVITYMSKRDKDIIKKNVDYQTLKKDVEKLEGQMIELKEEGRRNEEKIERKIDLLGEKIDQLTKLLFESK